MLGFLQSRGTAFFAGVLSLASQIVGLKIVTNEVSASELAIASVLVSALCGLSLGALIAGRVADRRGMPLRMANLLLLLATAAVLMLLIGGRDSVRFVALINLPEWVELLGFALFTILPINLLLGGIVPVLTKASIAERSQSVAEESKDVRKAFGSIYTLETLGAAVGSLVLTFIAIPELGVRKSLLVTSATVLIWTAVGLVFSPIGKLKKRQEAEENDGAGELIDNVSNSDDLDESVEPAQTFRWFLLVAAFAASCASLGMELVWQRYFAVIFGSDTHSYAIVATMFLAGNSLGAFLVTRFFRFETIGRSFYQWQLLLIGILIAVSMWTVQIGFQTETLQTTLAWLFKYPLMGRLGLAAIVVLAPSILIGSALPVLVSLWSAGRASFGTHTGQIYSWVIAGNVVGVLFCAIGLIPALGLRITAIVLAGICVAVSVGLFFLRDSSRKTSRSDGGILATVGYGGLLAGFLALSIYLVGSPFRPGFADEGDWVVDHYVEKASQTVAVIHAKENKSNKRLVIDGVTIGESGGGVDEKQQVLAHLPFMIGKGRHTEVLTIGLGTGILAGELASNDQVEAVTCVELSAAVIKASEWFEEENHQVLQNDKFTMVHGDGVRYLRNASNAERAFDVIVSDGKSRPGAASNLPFFSEEFYRLCAKSLSDQGVFVQWVSLRCDQDELKTILVTFSEKFPYGHMAIAAPDSVYLVGSPAPIHFDRTVIENHLQSGSTETLKAYSWNSAEDILSMYWLDDDVVKQFFQDVAANTFDRPVLERFAWKSFGFSLAGQPTQMNMIQKLVAADTRSLLNGLPLADYDEDESIADLQAGRFSALEFLTGDLNGRNAAEEFRIGNVLEKEGAGAQALQHYFRAVELSGSDPKYLVAFGEVLMRQGKYSYALKQFESAIAGLKSSKEVTGLERLPRVRLLKAIAMQELGHVDQGNPVINKILAEHPDLLEVYRQFSQPAPNFGR